MITHYDMTTGEVIADDGGHSPAGALHHPARPVQLRLAPVQEMCRPGPAAYPLPADLADLPVETMLAQWCRGL